VQLSPQDDEFRGRVRQWLAENLTGRFAELRGAGGPGREHEAHAERLAWNGHLAAAGWTCLGWPAEFGGRGATLAQQVIFHEEYARSGAPARVGYMGEELLGPTLIAFGTPEQQRRFLPAIAAVRELWCQGYSEPDAGSDLAAVATSATLDGGQWVVTGQKVWTSLAHVADWCFVLARTQAGSRRGAGLSYLLVPMRQPAVTVRPIRQLTGTSEFNEVFFDGARTAKENVLGPVGQGYKIAIETLNEGRIGIGAQMIGLARGAWEFASKYAQERKQFGKAIADFQAIQFQIAQMATEIEAARLMVYNCARMKDAGVNFVKEAAMTKLFASQVAERVTSLAIEIYGGYGFTKDYPVEKYWRDAKIGKIYEGTSNMQLATIAKLLLGGK